MEIREARLRNIKMKIANAVIHNGVKLSDEFTYDIKRNKVYLKKSDIEEFNDELFNNNYLNNDVKTTIQKYIEKYNNSDISRLDEFADLYLDIADNLSNLSDSDIQEKMRKATVIASKLHWRYLPVYVEQYIVNNGVLPEEDPGYFYNHFHMIEDLYRYIFTDNKVNWRSLEGDINIDKPMNMKIYTTRWGHYDNYSVARTSKGWKVEFMIAGGSHADKNGEGAFFNKLEHDSVFYPKDGLEYAMETLWTDADTTEMTVEELQAKLNDIARWIEAVEKATKENQPEWCPYY